MTAALSDYLSRARELPLHLAAGKAMRLAGRLASQRWQQARDRRQPSHAADAPTRLVRRLALSPADAPATLAPALAEFCRRYGEHRFDLLGSGWVTVQHGMAAAGVEGHRYPPAPPLVPDTSGDWLAGQVNAANLGESRRLWRLIEPPYRPIDWQLDFKSGHRWDGRQHFRTVRYGDVPGADVKVPWELARLQHLPQLAAAYMLAKVGHDALQPPDVYVREVRNQVLDFLAANPPRFGVNWACPMDVGIRAANILLAVDMLRAGGWQVDAEFEAAVARAALEHGRHVIAHLEWSEQPRSNHYLSDLVGVLFCAAYLPRSAETDAWRTFTAAELDREIRLQFLADGGNHEGSTNYHRLSTELATFAAALLLGLWEECETAVETPPLASLAVRPPLPRPPLPRSTAADGRPVALSAEAVDRLAAAHRAARCWKKPDGRMPQVGDTDSGRLFKLTPTLRHGPSAELENSPLDQRPLEAAGAALFGAGEAAPSLDAIIVGALARGRRLPGEAAPAPADGALGDAAALDASAAAIRALPPAQQRAYGFALAGFDPETLVRHALPHFGLYVFRSAHTYLHLRCVAHDPDRELGHAHDDNLALELHHAGADLIADPGSYLYTPAPALRDTYRSAAAHFAPRPAAGPPAAEGTSPFAFRHRARGECLYFGPEGIAAVLHGPGWRVRRVVRLAAGRVEVLDGCTEQPLADDRSATGDITVSEGYGHRTACPVRAV